MSTRSAKARSRQKSCTICVEGKRRCDRQTPQCSRCAERGLKCTYIKSPSNATARSSKLNPASPQSPRYSSIDPVSEEIFAGWSLRSQTLVNTSPRLGSFSPLTTMPAFCPAIFFPDFVRPDRWSIEKVLKNMRSFPEMLARSGATPFMHVRLYESDMPTAIQDAFAVSAVYLSRTAETKDLSLRVLEAKSKSLIQQLRQTSSLRELLASVQALLIFQIIQLFQGDTRVRALAEQNMELLREWTTRLQMQGEDLRDPVTWQDWIFAESIRRTVVISILLDSLYWTLQFGYCTQAKVLSMLPVTPVSELWECSSRTGWSGTVPQKTNAVLYGDFAMAWKEGRVNQELDDFQRFLLAPCVGEKYRDVLEA